MLDSRAGRCEKVFLLVVQSAARVGAGVGVRWARKGYLEHASEACAEKIKAGYMCSQPEACCCMVWDEMLGVGW